MADIYIGDDGDLVATAYGDIAIIGDDDDILQMAINNVRTILGENQFHPEIGNNVFNRRMKVIDSDAETIAKDCINAIKQDDRVRAVKSIEIYADGEDRHNLDVQFTIITIGGNTISSTVQIQI